MATIQVRVSDKDKKAAEKILESLGLDLTTAVRMYVKRIVIDNGVPFPARHGLTVNGFTPEFEQEVLRAAEQKGGVIFEDPNKAVAYLRNIARKP
jgi:addiction module RelB/DinJ family antitoxin